MPNNSKLINCNENIISQKRYSGRIYDNPKEKIEAIKNKYKNGVSIKVINNLVDELMSQGEWRNER